MDTWYVVYGSTVVYIPIDKGDMLTVSDSGEIMNVSASAITCFATDGYSYRFSNFGGLERRPVSGSTVWVSVPVYVSSDNHLPINCYDVPFQLIYMALAFAVVFNLLLKRIGVR